MSYISVIEARLKEKGLTAKKMLLDLGYSDNLISQWKKGSEPSAVKLNRIAQYLELSLDLLFENDIPNNLSDQDKKLLKNFKTLDETEQQIILGKISEFLYNKKMEENSEKFPSKVLWDLLADSDCKSGVKSKHND